MGGCALLELGLVECGPSCFELAGRGFELPFELRDGGFVFDRLQRTLEQATAAAVSVIPRSSA